MNIPAVRRRKFAPQPVPVPEPWTAVVVPVSAFPAPEDERAELRSALRGWSAKLAARNKLIPGTWLQMTQLHLDQGAQKLSANGQIWLPMTGLGVWPDREPPRLWTRDDFEDREFGQPMPPLMNTVFHVSGGGEASHHARDLMIGSGTVVHALLHKSGEEYHTAMREVLLPGIEEEALRGHPFYIPLLEAKSLQNLSPEVLDEWMGPASVYVRESVEDCGIFIICSIPRAIDELFSES
jgi:hypothetical protein